jgi:3-oxoadipate enol-lactonase/4-carboxymuconolactone decarboxylase
MTPPRLHGVLLSPERAPRRPLLVVGPSLGTSTTLWERCAAHLADELDVLAWDLPGHGASEPATVPLTVADLAAGVLDLVDRVQGERGSGPGPFSYAGDSIGGAVGLQLALDAPERVAAVAVVCSGAQLGERGLWAQRAATVRESGTAAVVETSAQRWFPAGFVEQQPDVAVPLLEVLRPADGPSYALLCEALAAFDVRDRLREVAVPVLAISGALDVAAPPAKGAEVAAGVQRGRSVVIDGAAHLAPAEAPERLAALLRSFFGQLRTQREVYDAGMMVRREVLGDAHVDRATAAADELTSDFQELITRYAWGSIWTRPGLDRRSRSMITLTSLVAHGHWEELAMHVRAALRNGLTREEIREVLLNAAIYSGVPAANSAFRVAQEVFRADGMAPDAGGDVGHNHDAGARPHDGEDTGR